MHHTNDDTEMATIRRSGNGWQVLIRRKNYVGPRSRTFLSKDLAQSWANTVEERTKKVLNDLPVTLGDAINDYINGPLLLHRSAENEISRDKDVSKGGRPPWKYGPKTFPTYGM